MSLFGITGDKNDSPRSISTTSPAQMRNSQIGPHENEQQFVVNEIPTLHYEATVP